MEKVKVFQEATYNDSAEAKAFVDKYEKDKKKMMIGLAFAAAASLLNLLFSVFAKRGMAPGIITMIRSLLMIAGPVVGFILVGGFLNAVKISASLAFTVWKICSVILFPIGILIGLMAGVGVFFFLFYSFLAFPIIPVGLAYMQKTKDMEAAASYTSVQE